MFLEAAQKLLPAWVKQAGGNDEDVVLSSRVRLARNLGDLPFPHTASDKALDEVIARAKTAIERSDSARPLVLRPLEELTVLERQLLVEKHLVSPQHAELPQHRGVIENADESISVMVNEEDHLRIQAILPGEQLENAWQEANRVDDLLEASMDYAFHDERGFLTACPTNVGTGMRASIMVHLPALALIDRANRVLSALPQIGLNVRGLYGEGSEAHGNIYQVSNQVVLGRTENEIIDNLKTACAQILENERAARKALAREMKGQLEDRLWRSFGVLTQARLLTSEEALRLLSDVRLGIDMSIIDCVKPIVLKEMLLLTRPAMLQVLAGREMNPGERDQYRATVVREVLQAGQD